MMGMGTIAAGVEFAKTIFSVRCALFVCIVKIADANAPWSRAFRDPGRESIETILSNL